MDNRTTAAKEANDSDRELLARAEEKLEQSSWYRQTRARIARVEAAQLLAQNNQNLLDGAAEALDNMFPASASTPEQKAQRKAGIGYCLLTIRYSLLSGDLVPVREMLVARWAEIKGDFHLSAGQVIAIFNLINDAPTLASFAAETRPIIEDAIALLALLEKNEEPAKARVPEPAVNGEIREILSLEEIKKRYPNEWVLIAYSELDEGLNVICGEVLAHSPDCDDIYARLSSTKDKPVAIEYAGSVIENNTVIF